MAIINQQKYREWALHQDDLPLFFQPWWLDVVNGDIGWNAIVSSNKKTGAIEGVFPFRTQKKWKVLSMITNPMMTPFNGPWLVYPLGLSRVAHYSFEMRVLTDLANELPAVFHFTQKCHYQFKNWLPFYHLGFRQTTRYSYVIDDISDTDVVWKGMKKTHRNEILKAQKQFAFETSTDIDILYDLVVQVFEKQNKKIPVSRTFFQKVHEVVVEKKCSKIILARNKENNAIEGGIWLIHDNHSVYLMSTGRKINAAGGEVAALIWEGIKHYSGQGVSFDFEGSMMKGVEAFFRRFGGEQKPYFQLKKGMMR